MVETELPLYDAVEGVRHVSSKGKGSAHVPFLVSITALTVVIIVVDAVLAPSVRTTKTKIQEENRGRRPLFVSVQFMIRGAT